MPQWNRHCLLVCLLLVAVTVAAVPALAQSQASTGQIAGVVKDSAGAVVPNAAVKVTNSATGFSRTFTTSETGLYRAVLLPPGVYEVSASASSFAPATANRVEVGTGRTPELNFTLAPSGRKEEVNVTAAAIEVSRHEEAAFVRDTVVANVPLNGRRFHDIATLTPTVQIDPQRGGIAMAGQRMVNTGAINIDGADYGQLFFGGIRGGERAGFAPTVPLESIQEFQIVRAGYTAEFGRSTGGVMSAITKSGTNSVHGSALYSIRHESLARSNEFFDTVHSQLLPTCPTCVVNPNPTLQQWGGSIGGPVKKDKFFLFGSYDQQRQRIPHQVFFDKLATLTPTANTQEAFSLFKSLETPFQQTNDAWLFLLRGDYQFSDRHRLMVRYNHSNYEGKNAVSVGTALAPTLNSALSNNGTEQDKTRTVMGQFTSYFSRMANEFRAEYARETRPRLANALQPTVGSSGGIGAIGTTNFLGQNMEYDYRIQLSDNVTVIKDTHTFKLGFEYNHLFATQTFGFNQFGNFGFLTSDPTSIMELMSLGGPTANRFDSTNVTYSRQIGNLAATLTGEQFAGFAQDSWRLRPTFTVNYGLRWEGVLNPQPAAGNPMTSLVTGFQFPSGKVEDPSKIPNQLGQFAPRAGFAWDPRNNGKTIIRGFGGVYYAATPVLLYAGPVNNFRNPPGDLSITLPITGFAAAPASCPAPCNTVYKQLLIAGVNLNGSTLDQLPVVSIDQIQTIATALGFNAFGGAGPILVDRDYHNPRSYQAGFGVEHEISHNWTVAAETTWIHTVFLERNTELNMPLPSATDAAGRPLYGLTLRPAVPRPIPGLGSVQIRDASAKSLYRGVTFRTNLRRRWGELFAYYTLSENLSDDDNERTAGGVAYVDTYNLSPEYYLSNLDRRHQFVAVPVIFLPWHFEVSSSFRLLSGAPQTATFGSDANQDKVNNDRPYSAFGVPFRRNSLRDRALSFIDMRVQKAIPFNERKQLKLSAEFFNLFNFMNLTYSGTTVTNYCASPVPVNCGFSSPTNPKFLQLRDPVTGALLTNNNPGLPFQVQFGARFVF